ncbi:hypothetical protein KZ114_002165 [Enterococcus faecalis]|uniref:hypothetical protein n=1 Tax=Enterococcus faecalis TaxID=1351 RepID=UPI001B1E3175|nr:hypothetical protein [Enterococcus faecalis]EHV0179154.1 hypothetical protein [Enterococcus faecalis]MCH1672893.1 hypothetical protein [Enterococcus faecalis]HBA1489211.1 hypothetical protein [Enterococcus faecalis]
MRKYVIPVIGLILLAFLIISNFWVSMSEKKVQDNKPTVETTSSFVKPEISTKESEKTETSESKEVEKEPTVVQDETYAVVNQQIQEFVTSYYTYETYGDNYEKYSKYLSNDLKEEIKQTLETEKKHTNIVALGNSKYQSGNIYIEKKNDQRAEGIVRASVKVQQVDTTNNQSKTMETQNNLLIRLDKTDNKSWEITKIQPLRITENYY